MEGELPTLPGYDPVAPWPARTASSCSCAMSASVGWAATAVAPIGRQALVNRYSVERVEADIMLGFFFPGAAMPDTAETDAAERAPARRRSAAGGRADLAAAPAEPPAPAPVRRRTGLRWA